MQGFVRRFKARYGEPPNTTATLGYEAAILLFDALRRAGSTDAARLRDAIAATRNFPGVTGAITIDAQRNAAKPAVILRVKNGAMQFVESVAP